MLLLFITYISFDLEKTSTFAASKSSSKLLLICLRIRLRLYCKFSFSLWIRKHFWHLCNFQNLNVSFWPQMNKCLYRGKCMSYHIGLPTAGTLHQQRVGLLYIGSLLYLCNVPAVTLHRYNNESYKGLFIGVRYRQ